MSRKVADVLWEMLANAGVKRCYGIVGDALNPVIDALRRSGKIEFIHVRHEEYGVFAAVAEAYLTGNPVAVCGTAGPGVVHLFNGLMDARKEGAAVALEPCRSDYRSGRAGYFNAVELAGRPVCKRNILAVPLNRSGKRAEVLLQSDVGERRTSTRHFGELRLRRAGVGAINVKVALRIEAAEKVFVEAGSLVALPHASAFPENRDASGSELRVARVVRDRQVSGCGVDRTALRVITVDVEHFDRFFAAVRVFQHCDGRCIDDVHVTSPIGTQSTRPLKTDERPDEFGRRIRVHVDLAVRVRHVEKIPALCPGRHPGTRG